MKNQKGYNKRTAGKLAVLLLISYATMMNVMVIFERDKPKQVTGGGFSLRFENR